ncbi:DUF6789 family protein [Halobacterium yunchengense]|uniref:DUF6789 family protein n=1 Tax=Halobacterium yunchengense TaxID=3108497 RepID=UPI00300AA790
MDPLRSTFVAGVAATGAFVVALVVTGVVVGGTRLFVFSTIAGLCAIGGPPYCALNSPAAVALTALAFLALFVVAWPLVFAAWTWALPGESGVAHGVTFTLVLWAGYAVTVVYGVSFGSGSLAGNAGLLAAALVSYLVYGAVLGGTYDYVAAHRTLME